MPFMDVALIEWVPLVTLTGRVAVAVNAPLASVVTSALVARVLLSTMKVTCWLFPKPEPARVSSSPGLIVEGVGTSVALFSVRKEEEVWLLPVAGVGRVELERVEVWLLGGKVAVVLLVAAEVDVWLVAAGAAGVVVGVVAVELEVVLVLFSAIMLIFGGELTSVTVRVNVRLSLPPWPS